MKRPTSRRDSLQATTIAACTVLLALQAGKAPSARADDLATGETATSRTDTAFSCDPARFGDKTHYVKVRMNGDAIASIHVLRIADGKEMMTSHPYGTARAIVTDDTRELCMKPERLDRFVHRIERRREFLAWLKRGRGFVRRLPARGADALASEAPAPEPGCAATNTCNTGLQIGWNDSTGPTQGECYNFTIEAPVHKQTSLSFTSEGAAHSVGEQTKVSATIGGAYGAFSANDSFSYSDQWQASAYSGNVYFNIGSIWQLNTVLDLNNALNQSGLNAQTQGNLPTLCGLRYMESVPAGMLVTLALSFGSSSESTSEKIGDQFNASYGLDNVHLAAQVSEQSADSSSYFDLNLVIIGGGPSLSSVFSPVVNGSDMTACEQANASACESFTKQLAGAASTAIEMFNEQAENPAPGTDIDFFAPFPQGVAGAASGDLVTASALSGTDTLQTYSKQLEQYLTIINEISTLNNRATKLQQLVGSAYNPDQLNLLGYLDSMTDTTQGAISYATSQAILLTDLKNCLKATSTNVKDVCGPIIDGGETLASAYDWYDAGHGYPDCTSGEHKEECWFLQQNTIALQYTAEFEEPGIVKLPLDVLYVDALPSFGSGAPGPSVEGKPALVAFADRPWFEDHVQEIPKVSIVPRPNGTPIAQIYGPDPSSAFDWWGIVRDDEWDEQSGDEHGARTNWTTATEPSFADPQPIGFEWSNPPSDLADVIQTANGIPSLFTP